MFLYSSRNYLTKKKKNSENEESTLRVNQKIERILQF